MTHSVNQPSQGDPAALNAGLGQQRVGETAPGPDQTARPASAGGPGSGSGDAAAEARSESDRKGSGRPLPPDNPKQHPMDGQDDRASKTS
jgi:hypothetical protein